MSRASMIEAKLFQITYGVPSKSVKSVIKMAKKLNLELVDTEVGVADSSTTNIEFKGTRALVGNLTVNIKNAGINYSIEFMHQESAQRVTRASRILDSLKRTNEKANNDFSTRLKNINNLTAKELDNLQKKILGLVSHIIPDIEDSDITTVLGKDRKVIVVNIADVPTSLHDKIDKEVQKAVK